VIWLLHRSRGFLAGNFSLFVARASQQSSARLTRGVGFRHSRLQGWLEIVAGDLPK
jgi:hypothetical protein